MRKKMKRYMIVSMLLVLAGQQEIHAQQAMTWAPSIAVAQQVAARQQQLVLVHFWAPTCGPCVRMEQTVFADPQVIESVNRKYVPVKINVNEHPRVATQYGIQQMPMDVVLTPSGQVIFRGPSPQTSQGFIGHYQKLAASHQAGNSTLAQAHPQVSGFAPTSAVATNEPTSRYSQPVGGYAPQAASPAIQTSQFSPETPSPQHNWQNQPAANAWAGNAASQSANGYVSPAAAPSNVALGNGGVAGPATSPHVNPPQYGLPQQPPAGRSPYGGAPAFAGAPAVPPPTGQPNVPLTHHQRDFSQDQVADTRYYSANGVAPPINQAPAGNPPNGMDGYCPVTLQEQSRWQLGDVRWGAIHRGRTYLFSGPGEQQRFMNNPDFYAPMLSGHDPVQYIESGHLVSGTREHGVFYRQQVYLFSSEKTLDRFWKAPEQYHAAAYQAMRQADAAELANQPSNRSTTQR